MTIQSPLKYIKFLNLAKAIRDLTQFPSLNPMEECLLNNFALAWQENIKLSVSKAMRSSPDMSPSTVHRYLKALKSKGFISLDIDDQDNRIKYISHTPLSIHYFSLLGQCLTDSENP
ncbi:MAG: winged helix-turn-helix domain-containing protein [Methylotenera sp.]|nr:winged helix-turn-helix domain-containing protein [Methylotenera sp.]MSP99186.1 winged helix-turn-helix domain-containing protein [Methylotenera sp.]